MYIILLQLGCLKKMGGVILYYKKLGFDSYFKIVFIEVFSIAKYNKKNIFTNKSYLNLSF